MKKSLIALAFGTLGLGIAEFTMMGILPYVATDLGISIPVAGHFISAYALGVCFGAPMLLLARKRPLKQILLVLMALMIVGNICASMAPNYWVLLLGRFVSGLPHGAYFGVASIVAGKLADKHRTGQSGRGIRHQGLRHHRLTALRRNDVLRQSQPENPPGFSSRGVARTSVLPRAKPWLRDNSLVPKQ